MSSNSFDAVFAGSACVDIFLDDDDLGRRHPDKIEISVMRHISPGGVTLIAPGILSKHGLSCLALGAVGNDFLGKYIQDRFSEQRFSSQCKLALIEKTRPTSITLVHLLPDRKHAFTHCPGAGSLLNLEDVLPSLSRAQKLFHFAYPDVLDKFCQRDGALPELFLAAKANNLTTSLDLASVSESAMPRDRIWLDQVYSNLDIFIPSLNDISELSHLSEQDFTLSNRAIDEVSQWCQSLLDKGVAIAGLRLGPSGILLRTTNDLERLQAGGAGLRRSFLAWRDKCLHITPPRVDAVSTVGAGDVALANLLAATVSGRLPQEAIEYAMTEAAMSTRAYGHRTTPSVEL